MATTNQTDNQAQVFEALKAMLQPFANELTIKENTEANYYLETKSRSYKGEPIFFGAVLRKSYVSYHLMPLYWNPELLNNISPELKKQMQEKSCLTRTVDIPLLFDNRGDTAWDADPKEKQSTLDFDFGRPKWIGSASMAQIN